MQCYWPIAEPLVGDATVDKTKLNQWQRLSWRNVRANWNDNQTAQFRFDFEGMASNTMAYIDDAMLIDLTAAFGAGNEPTQEWCDANIEYFAGNKTIQYEAPTTYDLTSAIPSKIKTGDILNCPYSGSSKSITLPKGQYKLECWGAQGGCYPFATYTNADNNKGGYSIGTLTLSQRQNLHLYVGGAGTNITASLTAKSGGWNGGAAGGAGTSSSYGYGGAGGGGASDIRIGTDNLYARIIVAGGGGGKGPGSTIGSSSNTNTIKTSGSINEYGGGTSGGTGHPIYSSSANATNNFGSGNSGGGGYNNKGGSGGAGTYVQSSSRDGTYYPPGGGGGGGGWYGGGGGAGGGYNYGSSSVGKNGNIGTFGSGGTGGAGVSGYGYHAGIAGGGGGGSGYVYTSSTASNYPSGCLLNSSYYLDNASTTAGNTAFTSPTGTNETGHAGNGYIRITVIEATSGNTLVKTTSDTWKGQKQIFIKTAADTWKPIKGVWTKTVADTWKQTL